MLWGDAVGDPRAVMGADLGNFLSALDWSLAHEEPDLAFQLVETFFDPDAYQDLHRLLGLDTYQQIAVVRQALQIPVGSPSLRVAAFGKASFLADQHGNTELALEYAKAAIALAREQDDPLTSAHAAFVRGRCAFRSGDLDTSRSWMNEAMQGYQDQGALSRFALSQCMLASLECQTPETEEEESEERLERAAELCESALATYQKIGFQRGIERAMSGRAYVAYKGQDWDLSLSLTADLLSQAWIDGRVVLHYVEDIADIAAHTGQAELAARLYGTLSLERERYGIIIPPVFREEVEQEVAAIRSILGVDTFDRETAVGQAMTIDEAIVQALEFADASRESNKITLTPREQQVLPMVADGRTSREIGDELFLSHRTVETHIANIYSKLEVQNREQAIAVARESGILASDSDDR